MSDSDRRFVQIYTGNGKGKTTAAIGQAVRAAGCGLRSLLLMFMKEFPYSEVKSLEHLSQWITVEQYGGDEFVYAKRPPTEDEKAPIRRAVARARQALAGGEYDVVILDEVCVCVYFKLLAPEDLLPLFDERPVSVELVLTGRYCPQEWMDRADLVTEMTEVKHYYQEGILARKGFES
jgi:cob(I)alamin adenosyltransferase